MLITVSRDIQVEWEGWNLPGPLILFLVIGIAVACYALYLLLSGIESQRTKKRVSASVPTIGATPGPNHAPAKREKRIASRRRGNPIPVQVRPKSAELPAIEGIVVDRSRGGLLLSLAEPVQVGTRFLVRTLNMPDNLAWIEIEARHARRKENRWLVGCAFGQELPWNVLLLFG
jgi:hypothetical protein